MTRIPDPNVVAADEQAAEWCIQLVEGDLDDAEHEAFGSWYAVPANAEAFEIAAAAWACADRAGERPEMIEARARALASLRSANRRRWAPKILVGWQSKLGFSVALVGLLWVALILFDGSVKSYETGVGEQRVVMLDDGSRLSMDAATCVEVRIEENARELRLLAGRAKFDVKKDYLRPFSVGAADKLVVATGTSFSVELLGERLRIVLYEGRVEVLDGTGSRTSSVVRQVQGGATEDVGLLPGRELVVEVGASTGIVTPIDLSRSLTWEAGQISFDREPLASAVERLNRYSEQKLGVGDASAANTRVSGVFTAGDTSAFVEGVTTLHPVRADRSSGTLIFRSKNRGQPASN